MSSSRKNSSRERSGRISPSRSRRQSVQKSTAVIEEAIPEPAIQTPPPPRVFTAQDIRKGLHSLGKHPLSLSTTFLGVNLKKLEIRDLTLLSQFPHLMYVDVSENECKTLQVFNHLPALVQLNASDNALTECLDFSPPKCDETKSWSTGKHAIGSMLTLANLSSNKITSIRDLSDHPFLECLLLGKNSITKISGISSLKYLKVLDLSYNSITQIEGLDGLLLEELNLEGNAISSLKGLDQLHRLSALNANKNKISSLAPLKSSKALTSVCVEHNDITNISEVEALSDLPFLQLLKMYNNPCCKKPFFRERCVYRVPTLAQLNETIVTAEEKIRSANVYLDASRGDLSCREEIAHNNNRDFENYGDVLDDEELVDKRITRISEDVEVEDEAELEDLMEAANIMLKTETGDDDAIVSGEGDYDTDKVEQTAQLSAEVM